MLAAVIAVRAASKARAQIEWEADQPDDGADDGEEARTALDRISVDGCRIPIRHDRAREEVPAPVGAGAGSPDAGGWAGR